MKPKILFAVVALCCTTTLYSKQYNASFFGIKSDGTTLNTSSLQKAIDYISTESPGDTLTVYVGRYLTGSVRLKSNVTIQLREGAVLVGVISAYDYKNINETSALLIADGQENVEIFGKGVIEGNGRHVLSEIKSQNEKGYIKSIEEAKPTLLSAAGSKNISIKGVIMQNPCADALFFDDCKDVTISNVTFFGTDVVNSRGIVLNGKCFGINISDCYFQTSGKPLDVSENTGVKVENCKTSTGEKLD